MDIYIDSANTKEIKDLIKLGVISGVTTNPSLIAKEGKDFIETLKEIDSYFDKVDKEFNCTISAEVTELNSKTSMLKQAMELVEISKRIIIKVPMTPKGLEVVRELSQKGIRTNVTLIFSLSQALLAAKAGAWCVSPFVGRLDDINQSGIKLVENIVDSFNYYGIKTRVLAASLRNLKSAEECMLVGADIATLPTKVINQMFHHDLTNKGLDKFNADWKEFSKSTKTKKVTKPKKTKK